MTHGLLARLLLYKSIQPTASLSGDHGPSGKRFLVVGVVMCVHAAKAYRVDLLAIATCSVECVDGFEPSNSFTSDEFCSQVSLEETLRIRRGS